MKPSDFPAVIAKMGPSPLRRPALLSAAVRTASAVIVLAMTAALIPLAFSRFTSGTVHAQQQPPPAGRPVHFHGFTQPDPIDFNDHSGWTRIFDGQSLKGWDGSPEIWHVEDGAIVGVSTPEHPSGTTNIIWRGGQPANFELKLEMKLEGSGANGGIQYRSLNVPPSFPGPLSPAQSARMTDAQRQQMQQRRELAQKFAKWNMKGYQADFDYANVYTGQLYEQGTGRGIIAWRGQMVQTDAGKRPRLLAAVGSSDELKSYIKVGDWNQYEVIADGNTLIHIINGHVMAILVDNDPAFIQSKGYIGFEIEGGGVVKVLQKDIWLRTLP